MKLKKKWRVSMSGGGDDPRRMWVGDPVEEYDTKQEAEKRAQECDKKYPFYYFEPKRKITLEK
jgi:hypothetical protein